MKNTETKKQDNLYRLIDRYGVNQSCLELIRFFGTYPCARFNRLAVVYALSKEGNKLDVEKALLHLTDKGVVNVHFENNSPLYSLTDDKSVRGQVLELASMEWHQWQLELRSAYPVDVARVMRVGSVC